MMMMMMVVRLGLLVVTSLCSSSLLAVSISFTQPPVVTTALASFCPNTKSLACSSHVSHRHCSYLQSRKQQRQRSTLAVSSKQQQQVEAAAAAVAEEETTAKPSSSARIDLVALQQETINNNPSVQILSQDPLIYLVPNLLSAEECHAYREYVQNLEQNSGRPMTQSNPPHVSLELSKLWPLPFLSLAAGIPPAVKLIMTTTTTTTTSIQDVVQASLPNIAAAFVLSAVMVLGVMTFLRIMSSSSSDVVESALLFSPQRRRRRRRTSVAIALNQADDIDFIRPLVNRVSALTQHHHHHHDDHHQQQNKWEAPVVTKYSVGAIFAKHGDASPQQGKEWAQLGGQRVVTCICYLNTLEGGGGGGETYFDKLDLAVQPKQGQGLFFFPADSVTWKADDRTTHESLPPLTQEKWIVQMFGRAERVPPPLGLPDDFGEKQSHTKSAAS